jgi:tetratricopeptide (TPR) repeat protein
MRRTGILLLFVLCFTLLTPFARSQDVEKTIDSLLLLTKKTKSMYPDKALTYAREAYRLALSVNQEPRQIRAMTEIGWILVMSTKIDSSLRITMKAKDLAEKLNLRREKGNALLVMGINHNFLGDFAVSTNECFEALKIFESLNDPEGIIRSLNSIGSNCYQQGDFNKAYPYYMNALEKARKLNDPEVIANVLNNVGLVYDARKQTDLAIRCFNEAIGINQRIGQMLRLAGNYLNLGVIYRDRGDDGAYLDYYHKAELIYSRFGNINNLANSHLTLSEYYQARGDRGNAVKFAMMAYRIAVENNLKDMISNAARQLHKIYSQAMVTDSAYKYALIQYQYKDSIEGERSSTRLTQLELQYQYEKESREEKLRQQQKDFYIIIFIILVVAGLIITFLFLSRQIVRTKNIRLEKQRLSDDLEFKNKELTINVMNLLKKNEFLVDHTHRLIDLQQKTTDENVKTGILQLINTLQKGSGEENIWDEFEVRFKQVHSGFYDKLLARFPELTPNELKLCALLRLNLTTKEICELTGQRPASLDVARSRLRKKLRITNSQVNLVNFLSQI